MLYSHLLTRQSTVFSVLISIALASPAPQLLPGVAGTTSVPGAPASSSTGINAVLPSSSAAVAAAAAATQPQCLGVGASIIPPLGPGPNPGAAEDMGFTGTSGTSSGSGATARRGLPPDGISNMLYERQYDSNGNYLGSTGASDGSTSASDGSSGASDYSDGSSDYSSGGSDGSTSVSDGSGAAAITAPLAGTPIQVPPNTTYCGWLGGTGMQSDMLVFNNPGTYQLTWQNVTGNGQVSINYAEAGADSTWADQDSETLSDLPTIVSFPNDGIQYQVVYYGEFAANGLSWFLTQVA
ncbi:hypothetical protein MMC34_001837 [Xylographa carneopallida]|nr:hypothetical protein [Xylographa carneopallida]